MSDESAVNAASSGPSTAGALIRQARQAQGMHIAMLAAATKVPQRKLEALEADRLDELPDATFTRALAQTVCRTLKIDPAPVLALLPQLSGHRLEHVAEGINTPFRERARGLSGSSDGSALGSPAVWAPLLVLILAAIVYFLPRGTVTLPSAAPAAAPEVAASAVALPDMASSPAVAVAPAPSASIAVETVHAAADVSADAASAASTVVNEAAGALQLKVSAESWVEVRDGSGATLLSRLLQPGESVGVDGTTPLKLTIGNAGATQLSFRGKPVDLSGSARDNVARLELK